MTRLNTCLKVQIVNQVFKKKMYIRDIPNGNVDEPNDPDKDGNYNVILNLKLNFNNLY